MSHLIHTMGELQDWIQEFSGMMMEDEDFQFDQSRHPLLNDLVVDQVFSHITDMKTLKACRTVNRVWNEQATKQFQEHHCPINLGNSRKATKFAKTMCVSRYQPYSSFIIAKTYNPRFEKQFKIFAHNVKHLQLVSSKRNVYGPPNRDPDHINFANTINIIRETRNLESLEFSGERFGVNYVLANGFGEFEIPTLKEIGIKWTYKHFTEAEVRLFEDDNIRTVDVILERLFHAAPQLHTLRFEMLGRGPSNKFLAATQPIQTLKVLEINYCLQENHLRFLTPALWNLSSLKLRILLVDCSLLEGLLHQQANTLEHLDLNLSNEETPLPSMTFPIFPRLQKFKFISMVDQDQTLLFRRHSSNGETDFPALKSVWVNGDILRYFFTRKDMVTPEVEELIYEAQYCNSSSEPFRCLNTYFPKLKKLTMKTAGYCEIRPVFKTGNYLDELCIDTTTNYGEDKSIDLLLTGVPCPDWLINSLSKLSIKGKLVNQAVLSFLQNDEDSTPLMGLSNLKRFEVFSMQYQGECITDAGGYLGLLGMNSLDHLVLYNSDISTPCAAELKTRHKKVTVEELTSEERDAIREKQFALF